MAAAVIPPVLLPATGSVEAVRQGGPERREARQGGSRVRRRGTLPASLAEAEEPEPVRPPSGRLDVVA